MAEDNSKNWFTILMAGLTIWMQSGTIKVISYEEGTIIIVISTLLVLAATRYFWNEKQKAASVLLPVGLLLYLNGMAGWYWMLVEIVYPIPYFLLTLIPGVLLFLIGSAILWKRDAGEDHRVRTALLSSLMMIGGVILIFVFPG